jgi:micrococcal nuclease
MIQSFNLLKTDLKDCTTKNTKRFTFDGSKFLCKCIKVYDGDTITVAFKPFQIDNNENIYKYSIRLSGIDTPEIRTKNIDEKKKAIEIRDILKEKILNKFIYIQCGNFDKYGRLLAYIFYDDININEWLITEGFANKYDGGKKKEFTF